MVVTTIVLLWIATCVATPPPQAQKPEAYADISMSLKNLDFDVETPHMKPMDQKSQPMVDDGSRIESEQEKMHRYRVKFEAYNQWFPYEMPNNRLRSMMLLSWAKDRLNFTTWKQIGITCASLKPRPKKQRKGVFQVDDVHMKFLTRPSVVKNEGAFTHDNELEAYQKELDFMLRNNTETSRESLPLVKKSITQYFLGSLKESCVDWMFDANPPADIVEAIKVWNSIPNSEFWAKMGDIVEKTYPTRYEQVVMLNVIIHFAAQSSTQYDYSKWMSKTALIRDLLVSLKQSFFSTSFLYSRIAARPDIPRDVAARLIQLALANVIYAHPNRVLTIWSQISLKHTVTKKYPGSFDMDVLPKPFTFRDYDRKNVRYLEHHLPFEVEDFPFTVPRGSILVNSNGKWFVTWTYLFDENTKKIISYNDLMMKYAPAIPNEKWLLSFENFFFFHVDDGEYNYLIEQENEQEAEYWDVTYEKSLTDVRALLDFYKIYDFENYARNAVELLVQPRHLMNVEEIPDLVKGIVKTISTLISHRSIYAFIFVFVLFVLHDLLVNIFNPLTQDHLEVYRRVQNRAIKIMVRHRAIFFAPSLEDFDYTNTKYPRMKNGTEVQGYVMYLDISPMSKADFGEIFQLPSWQAEMEDVKQGRFYYGDMEVKDIIVEQSSERQKMYMDWVRKNDMAPFLNWIGRLEECLEHVVVASQSREAPQ